MIASSGSAVALLIDHDVAFLMWLGEMFAELGCRAVPALHCRQALALAARFQLPLGILVVNPALRGAERMVQTLLAKNPGARVIFIRDSESPCNGNTSANAIQPRFTLERPLPGQPISRTEWLAKVRKTVALGVGK